MYTITTVKQINTDNTVVVGCSNKACNGCKAEMFCNNKNDTEFVARNDKKIQLTIGQKVELFLPPGKTVLSTALVFVLPLILFPVGYLLMKNFTNLNEIYCAFGGIVCMAIAFVFAACISIKNKKALMPIVTRVVE